jgi:hypothetical protein
MRPLIFAVLVLVSGETSLAQTRPLELLPGDSWMRAARPSVRVAVARPLAGMEPVENWIEVHARLLAGVNGCLRVRTLHAAALRDGELRAAIHWRGPWFEADAAAKLERLEVETIGTQFHRGATGAVVFVHGATRFGAQMEFPSAMAWSAPLWRHTIGVRGDSFGFALQRRTSRYATHDIWSAGISLRLHERFVLGAQRRGEEILAQLRAGASRYSVALSLPLASPHGGGAAVGLAWYP